MKLSSSQLGVTNGVLNIVMPQVALNRASIDTSSELNQELRTSMVKPLICRNLALAQSLRFRSTA